MTSALFALSFFATTLAQTDANNFNQYLLLGYAAMWLVAFVYLLNLANKQRNLRQEIALMRRLVAEEEESMPASAPPDHRLEKHEPGVAS